MPLHGAGMVVIADYNPVLCHYTGLAWSWSQITILYYATTQGWHGRDRRLQSCIMPLHGAGMVMIAGYNPVLCHYTGWHGRDRRLQSCIMPLHGAGMVVIADYNPVLCHYTGLAWSWSQITILYYATTRGWHGRDRRLQSCIMQQHGAGMVVIVDYNPVLCHYTGLAWSWS